ncbi:MAG: acyltransferase family protein [Prevotella sp.]
MPSDNSKVQIPPSPRSARSQQSGTRLVALDVFRALTILLMILVNNGAGDDIYPQLVHSRWNGLTACDLVFPFFLYIIGFTTYISMGKRSFTWSRGVLRKILGRTVQLFLVGLLINWLDIACDGRPLDFAHLRVWGVMQRIAVCYLLAAAFAVTFRHRYAIPASVLLLAAYHALLVYGDGFACDSSLNILSRIDTTLFGRDHLYHKSPVDPEGLVSTIGAAAHCLLAFGISWRVMSMKSRRHKTIFLGLAAVLLVSVGYMLTFAGCPLNKRVWSPSYVLMTVGMASFFLALLIYIIDIRGWRGGRLMTLLLTIGVHPMFLYVLSEVVAIVIGAVALKDYVFGHISGVIADGGAASLVYSLLFIATMVAAVVSLKGGRR